MKRVASVIELKESGKDLYLETHRAPWPGILVTLSRHHVCNYSIYLRRVQGRLLLFSYFEYTGADYDGDMAAIGRDPLTQKWWDLVKPCHEPLADRAPGEWWAGMDEVFHLD